MTEQDQARHLAEVEALLENPANWTAGSLFRDAPDGGRQFCVLGAWLFVRGQMFGPGDWPLPPTSDDVDSLSDALGLPRGPSMILTAGGMAAASLAVEVNDGEGGHDAVMAMIRRGRERLADRQLAAV